MSITSVARLQSKALKGVTTEVMVVTPDMAKKLLMSNRKNRRIKRAKVDQFARAMAAGEFDFNGESVQIATDGTILNGQHRLLAIIESDCSIPLLIVRGLSATAQDTIDVGTKRSNMDVLQLHGESNASALAAIGRRALMFDLGYRTNAGGRFVPSELEIRRYIEANPSIRSAVDVALKGRKLQAMPGSVLGLAFYLCARVDHMAAKEFFLDQVINGIGIYPRDPSYALRTTLSYQAERRGRVAETDALGYTLRAWNAFRANERISKMQAPRGGWNNSNIPTPL